jgi:hypothetical protein
MADEPVRNNDATEIANAVVIAIAGVISALGSYQGSLWEGTQATAYSQSNSLRTESNRAAEHADTMKAAEVAVFSAWLDARATGDTRLADFYARRFPPDLQNAFNDWIDQEPLTNPAAPLTPFLTPSYTPAGPALAAELDRKAAEVFEEGQRANHVSDAFAQGGTILSLSLFFAGIAQVFRRRRVRVTLLFMAILACALGAIRVFTLPMITIMNQGG